MKYPGRRVLLRILLVLISCGFACAGAAGELLVDQYNQPVPAARLSSRWLLVYFGYVQCHDICPAALTRMKSVLARLQSSGSDILPVFITLDPAHDTPAKLREFARRFNPGMLALSGGSAAIAEAAARFAVVWHPNSNGADIDHGGLLYLVAPGSRVVRLIHPTQAAEDITEQIRASLAAPN